MPLMHSEILEDQELCVDLFESLIEDVDDSLTDTFETALKFAMKHKDVIVQYGRFPHRNAALERKSTEAELEYLSRPGAGF